MRRGLRLLMFALGHNRTFGSTNEISVGAISGHYSDKGWPALLPISGGVLFWAAKTNDLVPRRVWFKRRETLQARQRLYPANRSGES
jgi:hypothetical protein